MFMIEMCSRADIIMWVPFFWFLKATPFSARLLDSVAPEVNTISLGSLAPIRSATFF